MSLVDPTRKQSNDTTLWWHQLLADETAKKLDTSETSGLSSEEVKTRLSKFGNNEIADTVQRNWTRILVAQLNSSLVILLIVAATISMAVGEVTDSIAVLAIILLNTTLGFWLMTNRKASTTGVPLSLRCSRLAKWPTSLAVAQNQPSRRLHVYSATVWLWLAVASTFFLQLAVIYWPPMQRVFGTTSLTMLEFGACLMASLLFFLMVEVKKKRNKSF